MDTKSEALAEGWLSAEEIQSAVLNVHAQLLKWQYSVKYRVHIVPTTIYKHSHITITYSSLSGLLWEKHLLREDLHRCMQS